MKPSIGVLITRDVGASQHGRVSRKIKASTRQNRSQNCHASTVMQQATHSKEPAGRQHHAQSSTDHTALGTGIGGHQNQQHTATNSPGT